MLKNLSIPIILIAISNLYSFGEDSVLQSSFHSLQKNVFPNEQLLWDNSQVGYSGYIFAPCAQLTILPEEQSFYRAADDFVVPNDMTWKLSEILVMHWEISSVEPDSVGVIIFKDNNNRPGLLLQKAKLKNAYFNKNYNWMELSLLYPIELEPGRYWISVYGMFHNFDDAYASKWPWGNGYIAQEQPVHYQDQVGVESDPFDWRPSGNVCEVSLAFLLWGQKLPKTSALYVDFSLDKPSGYAPLAVKFTPDVLAHPDYPVTEYEWDLDGDGTIDSHEKNPEFTFSEPGTFNTTLKVKTNLGFKQKIKYEAIRVFKNNSCLYFDGISLLQQNLACRLSNTSFDLDNFTLEGWIRPTGWGTVHLCEKGHNGCGAVVSSEFFELLTIFEKEGEDQYLETLQFNFCDESPYQMHYSVVAPNFLISLDEWQHFAIVCDYSTGSINIYLNGQNQDLRVLDGEMPGSAPVKNPQIRIGCNMTYSPFEGFIDQVRLWNVARTPADISAGMTNYLTGAEENLVGYWQFDEGDGTQSNDSSPRKNHLTLVRPIWHHGVDLDVVSDVGDKCAPKPGAFKLLSNYPNPFNSSTQIEVVIPLKAQIELYVYNALGQRITQLAYGTFLPGLYRIPWDARDAIGKDVPSGLYFYTLLYDGKQSMTKKMLLVR